MITSLLLALTVDTLTITTQSRDMELGRHMAETRVMMLKVSGTCKSTTILSTEVKVQGTLYIWTYTVECVRPTS